MSDRCSGCNVGPGERCHAMHIGRCGNVSAETKMLSIDPYAETPWRDVNERALGREPAPRPRPSDGATMALGSATTREFDIQPPLDGAGQGGHARAKIDLPPLWRMAAGFIRDAGRHLINGRPKRSPEEYERIMAICRSCEFLRDDGRCGGDGGCGCGMETKASWALTKCPRDKW